MNFRRTKRRFLSVFQGTDTAETLGPRLLLSAAIDPATEHPEPTPALSVGRHPSPTHVQRHQVTFLNHLNNQRGFRHLRREDHPPAHRPTPHATPALAPAPINGARAYGYL